VGSLIRPGKLGARRPPAPGPPTYHFQVASSWRRERRSSRQGQAPQPGAWLLHVCFTFMRIHLYSLLWLPPLPCPAVLYLRHPGKRGAEVVDFPSTTNNSRGSTARGRTPTRHDLAGPPGLRVSILSTGPVGHKILTVARETCSVVWCGYHYCDVQYIRYLLYSASHYSNCQFSHSRPYCDVDRGSSDRPCTMSTARADCDTREIPIAVLLFSGLRLQPNTPGGGIFGGAPLRLHSVCMLSPSKDGSIPSPARTP
jgi:hypothetical protein